MFRTVLRETKYLTKVSNQQFQSIQKYLPAKWEPYYRLGRYDKQIGTQLVYIPCLWGLALGMPHLMIPEFLTYGGLMWVGAVAARSAGCIVNDMWDVDFDKKVERTKTRPLASGELSMKQAAAFFVPHVAVGLGVLTQMNWLTIKLIFGIIPVAALYPAFKRFTHYPQVVLAIGTAFNWGIWCGYAAISGSIDYATCGLSWLGGIAWTLIYDTVYAHQDKNDDAKIGVKSTALAWGDRTKEICAYLNAVMTVLLGASGYMAGMNWAFYPLLGASGLYLRRILQQLDIDNRESCNKFFVNNRIYGLCIMLAMLVGKVSLQ